MYVYIYGKSKYNLHNRIKHGLEIVHSKCGRQVNEATVFSTRSVSGVFLSNIDVGEGHGLITKIFSLFFFVPGL